MPPSSDLPPWLRSAGAAPRGTKGRAAATAALALVVFGAGAGAGFLYGRRDVAVAPPPPPPAPVCPPAVACTPPPAPHGVAHARLAPSSKRSKPAAAPLSPLPDRSPLDEGARKQALLAFAEKKAPELRDCVRRTRSRTDAQAGRRVRDRIGRRRRFRPDSGRGQFTERRQAVLRQPPETLAFPRGPAARRRKAPRELRPVSKMV